MDMTIISPTVRNALADKAATESTGDPLVKYFLSTIASISKDKLINSKLEPVCIKSSKLTGGFLLL